MSSPRTHAGSARREFLSGVRAELPILVGVIPFGLIYGVLALGAGLTAAETQGMSSIIFAGSAQFISTQMFAGGAPAMVIVLTVAVVNLRHLLYSASLAPYVLHLKPAWRWLLAYLLTDEAYAVTITHYTQSESAPAGNQAESVPESPVSHWLGYKHWFFLGSGLALWSTWQVSTALGILMGAVIPVGWSLDFAVALTFLALLLPFLKDRPSLVSALAAGLTAVLAYGLPYKLGLVLAALVGILVGVWMERRQ